MKNPCNKCIVDPMCETPCATFITYAKSKILVNYKNYSTWLWVGKHLRTGKIEFYCKDPGWRWTGRGGVKRK